VRARAARAAGIWTSATEMIVYSVRTAMKTKKAGYQQPYDSLFQVLFRMVMGTPTIMRAAGLPITGTRSRSHG